MEKRFFVFFLSLFILCFMQTSCFVPRYIWPQGDIQIDELNDPVLEKKVLVASRSSEFKDAVVAEVKEAFSSEPVYMKFVGIDQLKKENAEDYSAVVIISTCIAWKLDRHVNRFLNDHDDQSNMIVLTTSGDGDWLPKKDGRNFDAISSASKDDKTSEVAETIVLKVRSLLEEK